MLKLKKLKIQIALVILQISMGSTLAMLTEVGFDCSSDAECNKHFSSENIAAMCVENSCYCFDKKTEKDTECRPTVLHKNNIIGGFCPCNVPHSTCNRTEDICYCETDYMPTWDKRRCIRKQVSLGEFCESDKQCLASNAFSHCSNDTMRCNCTDGFRLVNNACLAHVAFPIERKCTDDATRCAPHDHNMLCLRNFRDCVCEPGFINSSHPEECIPERKYGEECQDKTQCYKAMGIGANCTGGTCQCAAEFELAKRNDTGEMHCKPLAVIGQYCTTNKDCRHRKAGDDEQSMECNKGECVCRLGSEDIEHCGSSIAAIVISSKSTLWFMFIVFVIAYVEEKMYF